jgi:hypothetical protein
MKRSLPAPMRVTRLGVSENTAAM